MKEHEINARAKYNAEVARGIVHTDEWKIKMAGYQERFDREVAPDFTTFPPRFRFWFSRGR
jgi:hypothetical protein